MADQKMTLTRMAQQAARDANPASKHGQAMIKAGRGFICKSDASAADVLNVIKMLRECQDVFGVDSQKVFDAADAISKLRA